MLKNALPAGALCEGKAFRGGEAHGRNCYITKTLLVMRLTFFLLTAAFLNVSAKGLSQNITFSGKDVPLEKVLNEVKQQTGFVFFFKESSLQKAIPVTIEAVNQELEDFLKQVFKNQPLTYRIQDKTITIKAATITAEHLSTQLISPFLIVPPITGLVLGPDGRPVAGANIIVKGTKRGTTSGADGRFSIEGNTGETLIISSVGFLAKEISIAKYEGVGAVSLALADTRLDEVQITAYGTTSRRLSTGNISTVKAADIEKAPVTNPLLAIEGRVPGVFIQQSGGVSGSGVKILIQGQNSYLNGNDPFFVVDGVPYQSQLLPGLTNELGNSGTGRDGYAQSTQGNPLNFINPLDIESIDILKDADATSIYGSRAANGAIIITTKKGKAGKTSVNFNIQQGGGQIATKAKLLNTQQYLEMRKEAYKNDGIDYTDPNTVWAPDLTFYDQNRYTDWQKVLIGGIAKHTNILGAVQGGGANTQYMFSVGYQRDGSVTPGDVRDQKASVHFNINSASENKKFKFNFTASYVADDNKLATVSDIALKAFSLPPNAPALYNADGTLNWAIDSVKKTTNFDNPLSNLQRVYINKTTNLVSNALFSYQVLPGLELNSNFGFNQLGSNEVYGDRSKAFSPLIRSRLNRHSSFNTAKINSWIIEPKLTYARVLRGGKLDFLLGATIQQTDKDRQQLNASGFSSDAAMLNIKAAATVLVDDAGNAVILSTYKYNAMFSRLNYNFQDKYQFSASLRRDGSSRFGRENSFHNFGSVAGGWLFSNESFVRDNIHALSFGKIKASYGTTGNDQVGDYAYLDLYGNTQILGTPYQGIVGLQPFSNFPNPYLQWELTRKFSSAMDLGFFKDRILLNVTYYKNISSNQLISEQLSTVTGGSSVLLNAPIAVQNSGLEMSLNTINIERKKFKWSTGFNLTINRNKLKSDGGINDEFGQQLGKSLSVEKIYHYLGVDPATGFYLVAGKDGKPTSNPAPEDVSVLVNHDPKFYGGFQNSFSYRGFSVDIFLQFVKQSAPNRFTGAFIPGFTIYNQMTSVLDRWRAPGDKATVQKFTTDFASYSGWAAASNSDKVFADASYIRLKNLSVAYQLPGSWASTIHIQNAKIYVQGQNLLTFTKYLGADPESRNFFGLPPLKVLTIGLQVGL